MAVSQIGNGPEQPPSHPPYEHQTALAAALRASEIRFRTAFANAPIGMTLNAPDGRILQANQAICTMLGYTESELLTMRFQELTHPDDLEANLALTGSALAGERDTYELEKRYFRKDGQIVWAHLHVSLVRDDGAPLYLIAQIQDVTTRKATEEALTVSEVRFRTAFEHAPIGMSLISPDWQILQINRVGCEILGYSWAELRAMHMRDVTHPDDVELTRAAAARALAGEYDAYELEKRYIRRDGQIVWAQLSVALVRDATGTPLYFISQLQDVSARKQAGDALRRSEARFRSLISNATDIITILTADGAILYESPPIARILGYGPDELVGQNAFDIVHPEDRDATWAAYKQALDDPALVPTVEFRFRHRDGSWRWLESTGTNLLADSDVGGFVVNSRDISERKRADEELRAALEAAQEGMRAKTAFLTMMSHELRTPLQAIFGYADLLLGGGEGTLTPDQAEDIGYIRGGAERLIHLIDRMLDLSRLDAGRLELAVEPVDLADLLAQVGQDVAPQAAAKGLELDIDVSPSLPLIIGDVGRLYQILLNLIGNAVKFTDQGAVRVTGRRTDSEIAVVVSDTGIGIAADALPHIFDEFRQANERVTRRQAGAGLGLAIARRLAEQHGGRISVASEVGVGSTFTLHLPIPHATTPGPQPPQSTS